MAYYIHLTNDNAETHMGTMDELLNVIAAQKDKRIRFDRCLKLHTTRPSQANAVFARVCRLQRAGQPIDASRLYAKCPVEEIEPFL